MTRHRERFLTDLALERSFSSVYTHVSRDIWSVSKMLVAYITLIWFFASVNTKMPLQFRKKMRNISHTLHIDKASPLCEYACAQRAVEESKNCLSHTLHLYGLCPVCMPI